MFLLILALTVSLILALTLFLTGTFPNLFIKTDKMIHFVSPLQSYNYKDKIGLILIGINVICEIPFNMHRMIEKVYMSKKVR